MARKRHERGLDTSIPVKRTQTKYDWPPKQHAQDGGVTRPIGNRQQQGGRRSRSATHHGDGNVTRNKARHHNYENL